MFRAGLVGLLALLPLLAVPGSGQGDLFPTTTQLLITPVVDSLPLQPEEVTTMVNVTYSFACGAPVVRDTIVRLSLRDGPSWLSAQLGAAEVHFSPPPATCVGSTASQSRAVQVRLGAFPGAPAYQAAAVTIVADAEPNAPLAASHAEEALPIKVGDNATSGHELVHGRGTSTEVAASPRPALQDERYVPGLEPFAVAAAWGAVALLRRRHR